MEDKDTLMRWVHESEVARLERVIKRLWILCIIIFVAFVVSNAMWIRYENQYEDTVITKTVETESDNGDAFGTIVEGSDNEVRYVQSSEGDNNN